jgi:hypothetical protein
LVLGQTIEAGSIKVFLQAIYSIFKNCMMSCQQLLSLAIVLFLFTGCKEQTNETKGKVNCNDPSTVKLDKIEDIALSSKPSNHSGMLSNNQAKGYKFVGKKGEKISYQTKSGSLCIWLYGSGNELIKDTVLPKNDSYTIQIASETAGTFDLTMSLGTNNPSPPPVASSPPSPVSTPTSVPSSSSPKPATNDKIPTQEEARNLIGQWLEAKRSVFGSDYEKQAGENLTVGAAYERNIQAKPGDEESSVDYLKGRGEYYTYDRQEIHSINSVRSVGSNQALVQAVITEHRTLHKRDGRTKPSQNNNQTVCYLLQNDGDTWKISKDPSLLKSCN